VQQYPVHGTDRVPDEREYTTVFSNILKLTISFCIGTTLVLLPLGVIAGFIGKYLLFLNSTIAWVIGGMLMILMGLQLLQVYKPPIRSIFNFFKVPMSYTITGAFLLGLSFGAITVGRGAHAPHRFTLSACQFRSLSSVRRAGRLVKKSRIRHG
jgi:cytochrome c biogenesis protein CcdA